MKRRRPHLIDESVLVELRQLEATGRCVIFGMASPEQQRRWREDKRRQRALARWRKKEAAQLAEVGISTVDGVRLSEDQIDGLVEKECLAAEWRNDPESRRLAVEIALQVFLNIE